MIALVGSASADAARQPDRNDMPDILAAERLQVEVDRRIAERQKFLAEESKLRREASKFEREHAFYPFALLISGMGAGAALMGAAIALVKYFHW